ncbi:unnamed protein product [Ostreobium quekettii]|uniref:Apple domain-containing protein n=1 Tax=Ostreobium quekettii TaxID=121088 RepID=A0A8S1J7G5_9CHLO|nr:unnamed protein product [Ostreobium quekettii]
MARPPIRMNATLLLAALALLLVPPPARAGKCSFEHDIDFRGSDINDGRLNVVGSAQECCDECAHDYRCDSWTYVKLPSALGKGRKVGECWLKTGYRPGALRHGCCISGVVQRGSPPPPHHSGCHSEPNYDYKGHDINDGRHDTAASPAGCCDKCKATYGCKSWTYVKQHKPHGSQVGECWLKDKVKPGRKYDTCCTSGVV